MDVIPKKYFICLNNFQIIIEHFVVSIFNNFLH